MGVATNAEEAAGSYFFGTHFVKRTKEERLALYFFANKKKKIFYSLCSDAAGTHTIDAKYNENISRIWDL